MEHAELLRRHLAHAFSPATEESMAIYAPEVVAEFPYAPEGHTSRLEGPEAIVRFLGKIPTFAEGFSLGEPTIHPTANGFVAEYHGDATFKESGRGYGQDYIVVFQLENGKISHIREYYDPMRVLRAMGEID